MLMVDLNSQCNLTGLVLGYKATDEDLFEDFYRNKNNLTMKSIVDKLISGYDIEKIMSEAEGKLYTILKDKLFLLPGHLDVSDLDAQLSVSLKVAYGIPAAKNIVENFLEILHQIAENYAIDYLLLDVSPNVGGLNEIALMLSDYFIVLTSPDYFCLQAIGSLTKNIEKWHIELINFKRLIKVNEKDYSVKNQPKFLGIVQQRYRPRKEKPASSFNVWIGKIREATNRELIPALQKINCILDENLVEQNFD